MVLRAKRNPDNWARAPLLRKETSRAIKRVAARVLLGIAKSVNAKNRAWMKAAAAP